jgi:hypothetical protein
MGFVGPLHSRLDGLREVQSLARFLAVAIAELRVQQNIMIGFPRECLEMASGNLERSAEQLEGAQARAAAVYFESQSLSKTKSFPLE